MAKKLKTESTGSSVSVGGLQPEIAMKAISKVIIIGIIEYFTCLILIYILV